MDLQQVKINMDSPGFQEVQEFLNLSNSYLEFQVRVINTILPYNSSINKQLKEHVSQTTLNKEIIMRDKIQDQIMALQGEWSNQKLLVKMANLKMQQDRINITNTLKVKYLLRATVDTTEVSSKLAEVNLEAMDNLLTINQTTNPI